MADSAVGSPICGIGAQPAIGQRWVNRVDPAEIISLLGRGPRLERWLCRPEPGGRVWLLTTEELNAQYERLDCNGADTNGAFPNASPCGAAG